MIILVFSDSGVAALLPRVALLLSFDRLTDQHVVIDAEELELPQFPQGLRYTACGRHRRGGGWLFPLEGIIGVGERRRI